MDSTMNFDEYQAAAAKTAVYPMAGQGEIYGLIYCGLKLAGEAGEVAEKIGKALRGDYYYAEESTVAMISKELGDVLWYVSQIAREYQIPLSRIARENIEKLAKRQAAGTLKGSGDDR